MHRSHAPRVVSSHAAWIVERRVPTTQRAGGLLDSMLIPVLALELAHQSSEFNRDWPN